MYIRYKGKSGDISIVNVNIGNCEKVITRDNDLVIVMPEEIDEFTFNFNSNEDANKALEKLFITLHFKSPAGNLIDLELLEEEDIIIEEEEVKIETNKEDLL